MKLSSKGLDKRQRRRHRRLERRLARRFEADFAEMLLEPDALGAWRVLSVAERAMLGALGSITIANDGGAVDRAAQCARAALYKDRPLRIVVHPTEQAARAASALRVSWRQTFDSGRRA